MRTEAEIYNDWRREGAKSKPCEVCKKLTQTYLLYSSASGRVCRRCAEKEYAATAARKARAS